MSTRASWLALMAAALYAISIPLSKVFLESLNPYTISAFLYLGAGAGMTVVRVVGRHCRSLDAAPDRAPPFTAQEVPYLAGMVLLDIVAPLLLLFGLQRAHAANASLLNNFEIVATALIALLVFRESISRRLWTAIILIVVASVALTFQGEESFAFSLGSVLILGAATCWGLENNCTRRLSNHSTTDLVIIKGFGSGFGALAVGFIATGVIELAPAVVLVAAAGFVSYGMSISFYIQAQKHLGAAKTSAYYAISPFIGVIASLMIFQEALPSGFWIGLVLMAVATYVLITDTIGIQHTHEHTHSVRLEHSHGALTHTHEVEISHTHFHAHPTGDTPTHQHSHTFTEGDVPTHSH